MNQPCNLLAFEAATQVCSVALLTNGQVFSRFEKVPKRSSEVLLPLINELLLESSISTKELNAIAVGHGPGSFMGVRLAVGVAQGLAFPHNIPLIGVSTLQILAQSAFDQFQSTLVLTAWDARMQEMYYGAYQMHKTGIMHPLHADQLISPHQYVLPKKNAELEYTIAGNAWAVYYNDFSKAFKARFHKTMAERAWIYPNAASLLTIAKHRYENKQYISALDLSPVYLRNKVTGQ
jgi:tRNA threonylcarbamoyladenosine biosynthesis protein TsaB